MEPKILSILFPIRTLSLSFSLMPPSPHTHPLNCLASSPSSRFRSSDYLYIISRGLAHQSHYLVLLKTAADPRVSTVRSAIELKQVFDKLQQAESAGLSAEQMRKLEEQAAEQGMRTLWKVCLITSTTLHHIHCPTRCSIPDPSMTPKLHRIMSHHLGDTDTRAQS